MENGWYNAPSKPRRGRSAERFYYDSRIQGDWESVEQDLYGYNSGGYDRVNPGWSGGRQEMKWGPAEVNPIWSSPDITYQRVGREVLYNPWFPKQEPVWPAPEVSWGQQPEVSWTMGQQEKTTGSKKSKSIQRSKSFSHGLLGRSEDQSSPFLQPRPLARSNSQVHLPTLTKLNFQARKNQFFINNNKLTLPRQTTVNHNNNNITKIELTGAESAPEMKPRGLGRSNSQLPTLPTVQKKMSFLRRLGSRAGMFKEARFSVVQDGGRRLMIEDGDKGRSLLLEDGKGGRPPPPFLPPGREGRILPSVHIQGKEGRSLPNLDKVLNHQRKELKELNSSSHGNSFSSRSNSIMESEDHNKSLTESVPWKEETTKMVSRRAILSRSRDDLNMDENKMLDDQWFSKEKLYKDHILEVLEKWDNIDDEIWAKVIVLERNRRIAKAYARAPVLTVNGSEDGFDGFRIGVNGFENPLRDPKTEEFKKQIGTGCKLKMDDTGNILVKRLSKSNIYVKNTIEENAVSNDILKLPNGQLEAEKPFKLFDMKKFQQNVNRELKRQYPERYKLETQCISTIALVKNESEVLDSPIWIMLINVVALEMLKAKMPRISGPSRGIGQYPLKKLAGSGSSDEDPYSLTPSGSSGSSGKGPRGPHEVGKKERDYYGPQNWAVKGGVNDLSDEYIEDEMNLKSKLPSRSRTRNNKKTDEKRDRLDDPYYNGMSARVPAFGRKVEKQSEKHFNRMKSPTRLGGVSGQLGGGAGQLGGGAGQAWWHSRLYPEGFPELSSYHDGGRSNAQQLPRNRFASPSRPTIFRSGWE